MNRCCPGRSQLYEPFGLAALLKANLYETTPGEQYLERGDWVRHDRDSGKEPEKVIFTLRPGDLPSMRTPGEGTHSYPRAAGAVDSEACARRQNVRQ